MIVRIMEENQYRLDEARMLEFERLDDALHAAEQAGDNVEFSRQLAALHAYILKYGEVVPYTEIVPSDVVVPADDMTLEDTKGMFPMTPEGPADYEK